MTAMTYDALVIGCGPGGSSVATFLARAGKRVLALEKEVFPRFHIGESLLPCNMLIFEEMGVMPALRAAAFPPKNAAQFELAMAPSPPALFSARAGSTAPKPPSRWNAPP